MISLLDKYQNDENLETNFNDLFKNLEFEYSDMGLLALLIGEVFVERPDDSSRLYTNLTSLKREHRAFLNINGSPLLVTDLVNSQIVFSIIPIEKELLSKGNTSRRVWDEFELYKSAACDGRFYEYLAEEADIELTDHNRSEFKKSFFREIFFSKPRAKGALKIAFKNVFPSIAKVINELKKTNHADFSIGLQRMEASIIIDNVLSRLIEKGITTLSIHDSIVVANEKDLNLAEKMISTVIKNTYKLTPKFKR